MRLFIQMPFTIHIPAIRCKQILAQWMVCFHFVSSSVQVRSRRAQNILAFKSDRFNACVYPFQNCWQSWAMHHHLLSIIFVCCKRVAVSQTTSDHENPIVKLRLGAVTGTTMTTRLGKQFDAFRGIPYAQPPVGPLRFKVKPSKWIPCKL